MNSLHEAIFPEEVYQFPVPPTIILDKSWSEVPENQRVLLSKILQAVGLREEGVRMLHQTHFDISGFEEKPQRLIGFIAPPKGVSLYEVHRAGQSAMIFSDPLEVLVLDEAGKRKLWTGLKDLFAA